MTFQILSRIGNTSSGTATAFRASSPSTFGCRLALPDPRAFAAVSCVATATVLTFAAFAAAAAGAGLIAVESLPMGLFWVEAEANVPTFLNYALLIFAFGLLALITLSFWGEASPWRVHWLILTAVFLLLTFDEAARLHETLGRFGRNIVTPEGVFRFAWVAVALPVVAIFALGYIRFLIALPRRPAILMLLSGCVYVGGAVGLEMVNGALFDAAGDHRTMIYAFFTLLEEGMEMLGITIFCVSLLTYLSMRSSTR